MVTQTGPAPRTGMAEEAPVVKYTKEQVASPPPRRGEKRDDMKKILDEMGAKKYSSPIRGPVRGIHAKNIRIMSHAILSPLKRQPLVGPYAVGPSGGAIPRIVPAISEGGLFGP